VRERKDDTAPPREWPAIQISASGYNAVTLWYKSCAA
jgi:hypothetical protein